jgi:hypothetical protein
VIKAIEEEGELEWKNEWNATTKGEITKIFFPVIGDRKLKSLQMGIKLSTIVTGHCTLDHTTIGLKSETTRNACARWDHRPQIT